MKNLLTKLILAIGILSLYSIQEAQACHAIALVNINQQNPIAGGIQVTAASNSPTCGCDVYWLDVEVRCMNEPFSGGSFSPGFWGPLNTYPYFQSAQMNKPSCVVQNYPWVTIPFSGLCPGMTYQYRMRENHNGAVGPWTASQTFTVPGSTQPLVASASASQTTICAGACVNLTSSVAQGCQLAATYTWDNGIGAVQNPTNICPAVTTTYCVTIVEQCSGFTNQACVTVNVVPPPVNGTATVSPATFCTTANPVLTLGGHQGTIQWQSAPNAGGPWTNLPGGTTTPFNAPTISGNTCYRAEITGCGVSGPTVLYSNVICVTQVIPNPPTMAFTNETCAGENDGTATATADPVMTAPLTYSWNTTPVQTTNPATNLPPGTYTVTITDANGCTATNSVTIGPGIVVNAGFTPPANQCLTGNSFNFNNTGTTGVTYNWDFGDGGTSTNENPTYTYPAAGTYTVTQIVSNGPCADTATATVTVHPMPTPTAFADSVLCNGDATGSATVNNPIAPGPGPYSFSWNSTPVQTTNPASNLPAGTYTVTVTDQTTNCTGQTTVTVFEPPVLTASATNVPPSCATGSDGTATATPTGGTPGYTYSWNTTPVQTTPTATGLPAGTYTCTITDANGCTTTTSTTLVDPAPLVLNTSFVQANCGQPDGSATVTVVSGGVGPFTYSWNTAPIQALQTAVNIPAGTYTVTVVDQGTGCTATATVTVTTTAGITANATFIADALCNGSNDGLAFATPTGGTAPYTYLWNTTPAQTNDTLVAGAGTYQVTITDNNGCQGTATVTINEPTPVVASIPTTNDASCFGANDGNATANGAGGTPGYTYSWNTTPVQNTQTATGLAPGTYQVIVTDANGCPDTTTTTILDGPALTSSIVGDSVSCFGGSDGSADLTVNGGTAPYTYSWAPSGSTSEDPIGLSAGVHIVTITSQEGCIHTDTIEIFEPPLLQIIVDDFTDVTCFGGSDGGASTSTTGGTPGYTYSWNTTPVQTTPNALNLPFGSYTVTVTDANGCTATANVNINQPPALAATTGAFDAYCGLDQGSVWVNPTNGSAPYTYLWDSASTTIGTTDTVNGLYPGTYNVTVIDSNGCVFNGTATINALPGGTATISASTDVSCFGGNDGTATVSVGGAFPGYTYTWNSTPLQASNPATGLTQGTYTVTVVDSLGCVMTTSVTINEPTALTLGFTPVDNACPDSCNAQITANVGGGTFPYNYVWNDPQSQISNTANGLCTGTYTVLITDANGCTITDSVAVSEPPPMVLGNSVNPANCNQPDGDAFAFVVNNGVPPYTFQWDDGVNVLSNNDSLTNVVAGTYFVTVTDSNGCSVSDTVTIPNLSGPVLAVDSVYHVQCFGGNDGYAEVQITGGTFPYTYAWNTTPVQTTPSASNLAAGTYTVTVTDSNGCVVSTAITINEPTQLQLTAGGVDPTCFGYTDGSAWVNAIGGVTPYTYSWNSVPPQANDSINGLPAGTYTVTVVDSNGCFDTASVTLVDPLLFSVNVTGTDVTCFGACDGTAMANLTNGIAPFTYQWDDPGFQTTDSIFGLCDTTFTVVVTDAMGCVATGSITLTEPNLLVVTENLHGDVSCNGGNDGFSSVNVVGGTGPYSYTWDLNSTIVSTNQSANNLVAGSYLVTVTDANGCTAQITIVINEPNPLTANATTVDVDCFGANTGSASVSVLGGTAPYTYLWDDPGLQQTDTAFNLVANTAPGYSVTVTDSLGCTITISNIIINEPPQLALNTTTTFSTCGNPNGSATVTVGGGTPGYNFSWNSVPVQSTATANNLLAGSYVVTVTDANGCIDSATVNVIDLGSPTVTIPTKTDVSCNGAADGTAQAVASGGQAPYTYLWNTGNPGDTLANVTGLSGQTYSVTVTDSNGCTASASVTIIENSGLTALINNSTNVSCFGGNDGDANVIGGGGGAPYTYSWNTAPAQTTPTATGLIAGTYVATVTDTNGCTATDTIVITEPNLLTVAQDSLSDVLCNGGNDGFLNVVVAGGTPGYAYAWTPNVSTGPTAAGLTAGNYSVTVTDANGCTALGNYVIGEPAQLVVDTNMTPSTCGQPNGSAEVSILVNSTPGYTYQWNDPNNQTNPIATGLNASTYTVTVTDANGCSVTETVTVTDLPGPIIDSIVTTATLCNGQNNGTATAFVSGNGPFSYSWDDPFLQVTQTATGLSASPPPYTVTVTDVNGCVSTGVALITQPNPLTAVINAPDTVCYGEIVQVFANANGGTLPYNYLWGGNQTGQGPIFDTLTSSTVYNVAVQDINGCQANATKTIIVRAQPQFLVDDWTICQGEVATLTPYNITGGNPNNPFNFFWMEIDSINGNVLSPTGVPNPTNPLVVSPSDTTDYVVWVDDGCSQLDTIGVTVHVNDTATGQLVPVNDTCQGFPQSFALTTIGGVTFGWDFDGDGIIDRTTTSTTTSYTYPTAGTYDVIVTITTAEGCVSTIMETGWATVHPNPVADFITDPNPPVVTLLDPEFDFIDQSFDAANWWWDFGDLTNSTVQNPTHFYQDTGFYDVQLIVSNQFGCYDTIVKTVRIKPEFFIAVPNTITPNGDGQNDIFMPGAMIGALDDDYNFYVFNRWGELIWEGHDLEDGWDGTYNGSLVQSGTYVWVIHVWDLQGVLHKYTGHVNVLR